MSRMSFVSTMTVPPGGYFYELGGDRVEGRCYQETVSKVATLMRKHGREGSPELELAEYMCPRMGPAASTFCRGDFTPSHDVTKHEAIENSLEYGKMPLVPFDVISKRLARCQACPKRFRSWCLTCAGHYSAILSSMGGRRPRLPADLTSGVCDCARAYEAAIASVDYGDKPPWDGVPGTCWRIKDV